MLLRQLKLPLHLLTSTLNITEIYCAIYGDINSIPVLFRNLRVLMLQCYSNVQNC